MATLTASSGRERQTLHAASGQVLGHLLLDSNLPLEQPCAGRGTCGKCKVIAEGGLAPPDEIEVRHLLPAERAANVRLACRARIEGDARVTLIPNVLYSNKILPGSEAFRTNDDALGLAIDLGTTTVAALLVSLWTGEVYTAGAALNQQTIFGADVISRLAAAQQHSAPLAALAQSSIYQALQSLKLSRRVLTRIERVVVVGNSAMHHLLMQWSTHTLIEIPFQPHQVGQVLETGPIFGDLFPPQARVFLPPLIGGFVGSDTTACLAYFGFDYATQPMLAIDMGTNGEVMVTDGRGHLLVASTAAGPAFEGVNISCGMRAVDGAISEARRVNGELQLTTIGECAPVGITGSGLLSLVYALREIGVINASGRLLREGTGVSAIPVAAGVTLTQGDVRELQKAKAAIRAATDILLERLGLSARELARVILTGSFGGQLNIEAAIGLGLVPQVEHARVELVANGAGLGAALFLSDDGMTRGKNVAAQAQHVELEQDPEFNVRFVEAMLL